MALNTGIVANSLTEGYHWQHHAEITSTNDVALALARTGAPHNTVITADYQTAGRGRHGAHWLAPADTALLVSLLVRPHRRLQPHELAILTGVAGVAALQEQGIYGEIKWPNDLMVDGRKVGGILVETTGDAVVIGLGVNCTTPPDAFPPELRDRAGTLAALGDAETIREELCLSWLGQLAYYLGEVETRGVFRTMATWNIHNWLRHRHVRVTGPLGTVTGEGLTLDEAYFLQSGRVAFRIWCEGESSRMGLPCSVEVLSCA